MELAPARGRTTTSGNKQQNDVNSDGTLNKCVLDIIKPMNGDYHITKQLSELPVVKIYITIRNYY